MWWAALLLPPEAVATASPWALQFTPRVALLPFGRAMSEHALVMELSASMRLFGGWSALRKRVESGASELGVSRWAWAPNSSAAVCCARGGVALASTKTLQPTLDALPLSVLSAAVVHLDTLNRLGCRTLGDLRALPRPGISRRLGADVLLALDQAHGFVECGHQWVVPTDRFELRIELPGRIDHAQGLVFVARRLLLAFSGWLASRQLGALAIRWSWLHDVMRARVVGAGGEMMVRTAEATRDVEHLMRLTSEHLRHVKLEAPVSDLILQAVEVQAFAPASASLLPQEGAAAQGHQQAMERIAARIGVDRVRHGHVLDDHRTGFMQSWHPGAASDRPTSTVTSPSAHSPQPTWLIEPPLALLMKGHKPVYQGELQLLIGPQRVDGGWWADPINADQATQPASSGRTLRDYWVALSPRAGVLWVFQDKTAALASPPRPAWFLHGVFA